MRNRDCYRLVKRKFQQRFAGHMHLVALGRYLDGRSRACAHSRAYGRAFPAANNGTDERAHRCTAAHFLCGIRCARLAAQFIVAGG